MKINELIIKDIRSFAGEQRLAIRPITYLVGENSTGKTTALACLKVISEQNSRNPFMRLRSVNVVESFNADPYKMGSFAEIVRKTKPAVQEFVLGVSYKNDEGRAYEQKIAFGRDTYFDKRGANIQRVEWKFNNGTVVIVFGDDADERMGIKYEPKKKKFTISVRHVPETNLYFLSHLSRYINRRDLSDINAEEKDVVVLREFLKENKLADEDYRKHFYRNRAICSIAPIRSKPMRIYEASDQDAVPEGDEIPNFLMNLYHKNKREWGRLKEELVAFGKDSGLFDDITVKIFEDSLGNPFQLHVESKGMKSNLIDVGYGVSQILPILVRTHIERNSIFLIQQPELHMHPRGQAALASLLIKHIKTRKNRYIMPANNYVIETHSDYMIDRTRIEISKGRIAPEDVSLIFLKKRGMHTKAYNITFDRQANFVGAPKSYGDFFIKETNRLIGFE